ncbi:MAG: response regulator transcription factor [Spirochaetales bacterium]|jgi:two-component system response regulator RegX3|uniref:Two-component system, OmpR family, response regulator RegX3 n=1 Tax=Treponema berlinense TaxID=225004 RepID=A0A1T4KGM4_9SPIR|nr:MULTISPECIES: response regulator transcription factor [Treponema]MDO5767817.1 response regulator transcription factor [Spirochaetales bacterium]MBQ9103217.1 response regulator transcription factor [Treponema sp.]MCI5541100.1 response regulator transcription factor [Treponema berlinense]MDD5835261.1 response regulator transcription factor [Treponema berlinense]MDY3707625.1 response regulator transcription factor [Treponema berlinense]
MNSKILVVEDVPEMAELASMYLKKSGMTVESVGSAEEALEYIGKQMPDLIILDLNLPGMSGFDFLKKFRDEYNSSLPVIIVSARDADEDIIKGLGNGADEFVTKPYSPKVLTARVEAILRRQAKVTAAAEASYEFGPYTVLLNSCVLKKGPEKIPLSTKEYEVLEFLISHENEVLGPEKIYREVWKAQYGDITAVAVYVQRLRKKIEEDPSSPKYIKTVFGMGYKFEKGTI